jgi:phosphoribosylpyrophosphate synthetase
MQPLAMRPIADDAPLIFAGSASRALGAEIAAYLGLPLGRGEVLRFSEGNVFVRVLENVRGRHVYLVQRLADQEDVAHPFPHILVVLPRRLAGGGRQRRGDLGQ